MNLPTYILLMSSALIYGVFNAIKLWHTNQLLFFISIFTTIVTLFGTILQSIKVDDFQFKWMLAYIIPMALLALSGLAQNSEISDIGFQTLGEKPPNHVIPGTSQDYKNAALSHWASMFFPLIAWLVAKFTQLVIDKYRR